LASRATDPPRRGACSGMPKPGSSEKELRPLARGLMPRGRQRSLQAGFCIAACGTLRSSLVTAAILRSSRDASEGIAQ
jgi:hypothetical protein